MNDVPLDRDQFFQLVGRVAAHLDGWTPTRRDTAYPAADLTDRATGAKFEIKLSANDNRLHVSGNYNGLADYRDWNTHMPSITLSPAKPAAQIARDIARRLIPPLLDYHARLCANRDQHLARQAQTYQNSQLLLDVAAGRLRRLDYGHDRDAIRLADQWRGPNRPGIDAQVYPDHVDIKLDHVPPDVAASLLYNLFDLLRLNADPDASL